MSVNNILPFSPTDTGTNLLSQSDYAAAADRTVGNQPGVASAKLNNKALRQATYMASQLAQYMSNRGSVDVIDNNTPAILQALFVGAFQPIAQDVRQFLTPGAGTYNLPYAFILQSGSATAGATYTNNAVTFTVRKTVASGTIIVMSGSGAPETAGILTKTSGTGDASITFYFVRTPIQIQVELVGGGGGGSGSGTGGAADGTAGTATTFGTTLLVGSPGLGGQFSNPGGLGGAASLGGVDGDAIAGAQGDGGGAPAIAGVAFPAGAGASSFYGGAGGAAYVGVNGINAITNSGSGGSGGSGSTANSAIAGSGGGAGGFVRGTIQNPLSTYSLNVGAKGVLGSSGASGANGGDGADGRITVYASFQ